MEKHWRSVISRTVCDFFFEAQEKVCSIHIYFSDLFQDIFKLLDFPLLQATSPNDVPPVIPTPHYYLVNIYRCNLYFVAVVSSEGIAILFQFINV